MLLLLELLLLLLLPLFLPPFLWWLQQWQQQKQQQLQQQQHLDLNEKLILIQFNLILIDFVCLNIFKVNFARGGTQDAWAFDADSFDWVNVQLPQKITSGFENKF